MATPTPVLDISTVIERPTIRINGANYQLRTSNEFTYLTYRHWSLKFKRLAVLFGKAKRSKKEVAEQHTLLVDCCKAILMAPDAVHAKLEDVHRVQIVTVFFELLAAAIQKQSPRAGAKKPAARLASKKRR